MADPPERICRSRTGFPGWVGQHTLPYRQHAGRKNDDRSGDVGELSL